MAKSLKNIKGMTLSVIDGNYPREVLANQNLAFATYSMPARRNSPQFYDAKTKKPAGRKQGTVVEGALSFNDGVDQNPRNTEQSGFSRTGGLSIVLSLAAVGLVWFPSAPARFLINPVESPSPRRGCRDRPV